MAKFYVAYKINKRPSVEEKLYFVTEKVTIDNGLSNKFNNHLELTYTSEEAFRFANLQTANEFISKYNRKKQTWYLEEIEVRLRKSKSDTVNQDNVLREALLEVLSDFDKKVIGEDGELYIAVKHIEEIL